MLRKIIVPLESNFTLHFPTSMVGKTVEIIAFELKEANSPLQENATDKLKKVLRIQDITKESLVDLSNFKFDRDEANNYDD